MFADLVRILILIVTDDYRAGAELGKGQGEREPSL